jgi:hypothetical protein
MQDFKFSPVVWKIFIRILEEPADSHLRDTEADCEDEVIIHKEKSNKMQQCIRISLFHIYMKLNIFQATHRPSSGA